MPRRVRLEHCAAAASPAVARHSAARAPCWRGLQVASCRVCMAEMTHSARAEGAPPRHACADAPAAPLSRPLLASAVVVAVWLVAASRWILTDSVVPWDSKNQFYAFFRFPASSIHAGVSPFWNPYHYGGHPSVADPQSLIFAPAFVLWALIDRTPSLRAFDLLVFGLL